MNKENEQTTNSKTTEHTVDSATGNVSHTATLDITEKVEEQLNNLFYYNFGLLIKQGVEQWKDYTLLGEKLLSAISNSSDPRLILEIICNKTRSEIVEEVKERVSQRYQDK